MPEHEVERVVEYLRNGKVVMAARSFAPDQVDPSRGDKVPLIFHTDGTWVWAGAVYYYLKEHGIPPQPELVHHIRARGFQPAEVDDAAMDMAIEIATGQREPDPPVPLPPPGRPNRLRHRFRGRTGPVLCLSVRLRPCRLRPRGRRGSGRPTRVGRGRSRGRRRCRRLTCRWLRRTSGRRS
ncbi:hypothetical protein [Actinomadura keratinilytica]|uniref:hypothetical protein n=1 Tax=Actinomadura keratinilytica TaxID=547461 RepID=UPI00361094E7